MKFKIDEQLKELLEVDADRAEYIPILNTEDEENITGNDIPEEIPILPLKNNVLYPGQVLPITVGRSKSLQMIKEAEKSRMLIGVFSQKDKNCENPGEKDLYKVGTLAVVIKVIKFPDGPSTVIIRGKRRVKLNKISKVEPYLCANVSTYDDVKNDKSSGKDIDNMMDACKNLFRRFVELSSMNIPVDLVLSNIDSPSLSVYFMASMLNNNIETKEKQDLIELRKLMLRLDLLMKYLDKQLKVLEVRNEVESKYRTEISKEQKEYILNKQLKTIQEELGQNPVEQDIKELEERALQKNWPVEAETAFAKELAKLERTHIMSPEYAIALNYLNVMLELPWNTYTSDSFDLKKAREILDADHFGLDKIKDRIISYLAVLKLRGDMKAPILCLYGPPGVGKTSLGKSIARAMGREYVRMSLGGLRDESEIRGHRRAYVGAMQGRILKNITKAKSSNPVFVLDEIDKVSGMNYNGDPSSALLEVLDPEQNTAFHDNFLDIDYDLSKVLFIATANNLSQMQPALLDRMELIEVNGYVTEEKIEIAKGYLIPKLLKEHGLKNRKLDFDPEAIVYIIDFYTRESGVRQLEKRLAEVVRAKAKDYVDNETKKQKINRLIDIDYVKKALGVEKIVRDRKLSSNTVGVVTGLSWSTTGGDILFIESSLSKGKGNINLTGNLGNVMQESAKLAYEYIKANASSLKIDWEKIENSDLYLHVPEGAIPKDGPSAGISIFTSMVSAFTGKKVRADVAMTGEICLRGQVLPVGGIREKILAAKRAGIKEIILSKENKAQIEEIPSRYTDGLKFVYVEKLEQVYKKALIF